jgi:hypothetical protein
VTVRTRPMANLRRRQADHRILASRRTCRAAGEAGVSMMTPACGQSAAQAKAVLGWTCGYLSGGNGFRAWPAERQGSNKPAALRATLVQAQPRLLQPCGCS